MTCDSCGHTVCNWLPSCPHCEDGSFRVDKGDVFILLGFLWLVVAGVSQDGSPQWWFLLGTSFSNFAAGICFHFWLKQDNKHRDRSWFRRWDYFDD